MIQEESKLPSIKEYGKVWEQRRYEIARTLLPTIVELCTNNQPLMTVADRIDVTLKYADELIKQLQGNG